LRRRGNRSDLDEAADAGDDAEEEIDEDRHGQMPISKSRRQSKKCPAKG
jgi:hypothetical protein